MALNTLKAKMAAKANVRQREAAAESGRRRSERRPYIIEGWLSRPNDPSNELEVRSLNVSQHGIAFQVAERLEAGQFFAMEIGLGDQRLISEVRIISCRPGEGGKFDVGAEFC